ncbi:BRO1 domain-containing protein BROX [Anabrus simplex]|uniref:BRO1 domain-containing protein BROX n=1 Tax=Anabrus simplex TaxID=316456 RepID=UPI0035A367BE
MAHWFHRNIFKATTIVNFDVKMIVQDAEALKICSDLKQCRQRLLQVLPDVNNSPESVDSLYHTYLSLMFGFLNDFGSTGPSKLRHSTLFKWTHTLLGNVPQLQRDTVFEVANMSCNVALWYMKHASMIAAKDDITMDEAKEVHKSLRKAAGIFRFVQREFLPQVQGKQKEGSDLDPRVTASYMTQCTAEAQEVTVARAVELKHNPGLISALANETARLFLEAANNLGNLEVAQQWKLYLQLKAEFYLAYAYRFCGENLLSLDKCGEAVRAVQEGLTHYNRVSQLCKDYSKKKGPAPKARPDTHIFFQKLAPMLKLSLDKFERENGFIYHQKVPADPPELEHKATYGLASPEEFTLPAPSVLWTPVTYAAFDDFRYSSNDPASSNAASKVEGELPPVMEAQVHHTTRDPKTESGCTLQ